MGFLNKNVGVLHFSCAYRPIHVIYICIYVHVCICMYICMYAYTYIYTHLLAGGRVGGAGGWGRGAGGQAGGREGGVGDGGGGGWANESCIGLGFANNSKTKNIDRFTCCIHTTPPSNRISLKIQFLLLSETTIYWLRTPLSTANLKSTQKMLPNGAVKSEFSLVFDRFGHN